MNDTVIDVNSEDGNSNSSVSNYDPNEAAARNWLKRLDLNGLDLQLNERDITNNIELAHALLKTPVILTLFMDFIKKSNYFELLLQKLNLFLRNNPSIKEEITNSNNDNSVGSLMISNGGKGSRMKRKNGKSYTKKKRGGQMMEISRGLFMLIIVLIFFTIHNKIFPPLDPFAPSLIRK